MNIFGYTWDAQQGESLGRRVTSENSDWALLERYGETELRNMQYFGVLDRLENTRQIMETES